MIRNITVQEERTSADPATGVLTAKIFASNNGDQDEILIRELYVEGEMLIDQAVGFSKIYANNQDRGFIVSVPDNEPNGIAVLTAETEVLLVPSFSRPFRMASATPGSVQSSTNIFARPPQYKGPLKVRFAFVLPRGCELTAFMVVDLRKAS